MPDQEKGFPPIPYILNVRFFSFKSLISIRKTNYFIRWIETYPVLYRYPPFEKTATWTFQDYTYRRKYNSIKNVVWPKHLLFLRVHALVFDWKRYCRMSKEKKKIGVKPLNWVWLQLDFTTNSSSVVSYYFVSGQGTVAGDHWTLVPRGRWEGERGKEVSFLLTIIPRTSLYRASFVNINRRRRDKWGLVRIWPQYSNTMTAFAILLFSLIFMHNPQQFYMC